MWPVSGGGGWVLEAEGDSLGKAKNRKLRDDIFRGRFSRPNDKFRVGRRDARPQTQLRPWLGHSSSDMLDLYYHLHDEDSQNTMQALAASSENRPCSDSEKDPNEGNLRAMGESKIEKTLQTPAVQELVASLSQITERAGFDLPSFCNILNRLILHLNSNDGKDLTSLVDLLFLNGFILTRDVF